MAQDAGPFHCWTPGPRLLTSRSSQMRDLNGDVGRRGQDIVQEDEGFVSAVRHLLRYRRSHVDANRHAAVVCGTKHPAEPIRSKVPQAGE